MTRMEEKVMEGEAVDLSRCERVDGHYVLRDFLEEVDYCDLKRGAWMWSIGKRRTDGLILASTTTEFYQNPDYDCLWLR